MGRGLAKLDIYAETKKLKSLTPCQCLPFGLVQGTAILHFFPTSLALHSRANVDNDTESLEAPKLTIIRPIDCSLDWTISLNYR